MDYSSPFCPDLVSNGEVENEHEKWNPINSIAVESQSFVPIKSEKREVKYNFILFSETESKRIVIFTNKSDTTENNKFVKQHDYRQFVLSVLTETDTSP
jgi:hypothetical protein